MFVDLKYISEQEKIIVSDDKGNMNEISYQDNAGDIYILKNIIERLEANKICLNAKQDKLKSELKECLENIKKKKTSKLFLFIGIPLSYTIFPPLFMLFFDHISGITSSILTIMKITPWLGSLMSFFILSFYVLLTPKGNLKKVAKEIQQELDRLQDQELALEKLIIKDEAKVKELENTKEVNRINTVPNTIVHISYREELELQRAYLLEMCNKGYNNEVDIEKTKVMH